MSDVSLGAHWGIWAFFSLMLSCFLRVARLPRVLLCAYMVPGRVLAVFRRRNWQQWARECRLGPWDSMYTGVCIVYT